MAATIFTAIAPRQQIALRENVKPVFYVVINPFYQHKQALSGCASGQGRNAPLRPLKPAKKHCTVKKIAGKRIAEKWNPGFITKHQPCDILRISR